MQSCQFGYDCSVTDSTAWVRKFKSELYVGRSIEIRGWKSRLSMKSSTLACWLGPSWSKSHSSYDPNAVLFEGQKLDKAPPRPWLTIILQNRESNPSAGRRPLPFLHLSYTIVRQASELLTWYIFTVSGRPRKIFNQNSEYPGSIRTNQVVSLSPTGSFNTVSYYWSFCFLQLQLFQIHLVGCR